MSLSDSAPTPTPGRTRSTTVVNPGDPCQMGCLAVRGVQLDGDIIATSGCGTVAFVPFISTENGKLAELVILLNDDARQRINASYDVAPGGGVPLGVDLIREVDGAEVSADLMGLREGPEYREARLHVGRRDITPLLRIVVRVSLPWAGFLCRKNTSATGGGLPWVDIELEAPPAILQGPSLAAVMVMGAASGALVGADLQTVAAMGMLGCAPRGSDSGVGDNVRALVPTALSNTCEGAIWGAVATLFVAVVVSTIVVLVYRRIKKKVSLVRACASMYCPSVALSIWGMLQTGLLVCGGQLMLTGGSSSFPGIVGLLFGLGIVPCYVVLADRIVSRRCYKMAPNMAAPGGRCGHRIMSFFLPTYELDKKEMPASKAFSAVVGRTRYSQSVWAAVWVSPPITLLLCVFARGELCKPMYMAAASCLVILAILHIAFRPNRSIFNNFLTAAALLINAALIGVGALLAYDPLDDGLQNASYALSLAQTFLTIIRLTITVTSFVIMKTRRSKWYTHQEPDGRPTKPDTKATPVFTVVGWLDPPLNAFGVPLEEFDDIKNIGDNNLEDDFINMDGVDDVDADDDDLAPTQIGAYTAPALLTKDAIEEQGSAPHQKSRSAREEVIEEEVLPDLVPTDRSDPSYSIVNGSAAAVEFGDGSGFKSECLVHGEHLTVLNNLLDNYHTDGAMRAAELPYRLRDEEQEEDEEEMQSQAASHNHLLVFEDDDDDYDGVLLDNNTPPLELSDTTDHDIDDEGGTKMSRNGRNLVAGSNGNGRNGMVHGMEEVIDSDDERLL